MAAAVRGAGLEPGDSAIQLETSGTPEALDVPIATSPMEIPRRAVAIKAARRNALAVKRGAV
jgi:hypothetical protein